MMKVLLFLFSLDTSYAYEVFLYDSVYDCKQAQEEQFKGYNSTCVVVTSTTLDAIRELPNEIE